MIHTIFGSPIVILQHSNFEDIFSNTLYQEIYDHLMEPGNKFVQHPYARGGKICTTDLSFSLDKNKIDKLKPLIEHLEKLALKHIHLFSTKEITNLIFDNTWINLTFEGCEIKNHFDKLADTNYKSLITLFYPKAPPGGSNFVFIHNSKYGQWASECNESDMVKLEISQGDVMIFDNSLLHAVDVHNSSDFRMCIAVEFKII